MMHLPNVPKMIHEKVTSNSQFQAMKYNCEGALNALAVNKDYSQVIVAGRLVFKILSIKEDKFVENTNLRLGKHRNNNLTFSTADVAWHPSDENIIASAAFNGSVVIWNLNMSGKSKQDKTLEKHDRAVTRVLFHETEHHQLLSTSQDGLIMIHDTREEKACMKFGTQGSDSVRDAQFSPPGFGSFTFAAAYEDGSVKTWDMRWRDRCERQFTAHFGPVFSLDWHPADKTWWLATAGRDKIINVWDMVRVSSSPQPPCLHSITNIAPVSRIKWRPNRKDHISSCSMVVDHCVNVWDLNRPYIPFAGFDGHLDVATSIVWREDCHAFLSCGKDGYLIQHVFSDARRPADNVNLAGVDLSINGDIGYAYCDKKENTSFSSGRNRKNARHRQFAQSSSGLRVFPLYQSRSQHYKTCDSIDMEDESDELMLRWFVDIAHDYRLEGASIPEICRHNGNVAYHFKKPQVAQLWRILAATYTPHANSQTGSAHATSALNRSNTLSDKKDLTDLGSKPVSKNKRLKERKSKMAPDNASGSTDESSDHDGESSEVERSAPELTKTNFLFGDGEGGDEDIDGMGFAEPGVMLSGDPYDWSFQRLPMEAFELHHEIIAMGQPHMIEDHTSLMESIRLSSEPPQPQSAQPAQGHDTMLVVINPHTPEQLELSSSMAEMIWSLADQGDIQSAVTMLIVLGDNIRPHIDETLQECWFLSYIDLLARFKLWTISNTVIKHCKLLGVCSLNQVSTTYHTLCHKCSKPCERAAWLCDKCKQVKICSICHQPVRGLEAWCQGCGHGGHLEHMQQWVGISMKCPAGCGHLCEYS